MIQLPRLVIVLAACVSVHTTACLSVTAEDWPQFLGGDRNGTSPEVGLIDSIDAQSPAVAWRVPGGVGMSAIAVAGRYAITTWNAGDQQWLVALDAKSGNTIWKTPIGSRYTNSMGDGPRATPAISEGQVFAYSGAGELFAADLKTGKVQWKSNSVRESKAKPSEYGMSSSPLVLDGRVIIYSGGAEGTIRAYDASSGEMAWSTGSGNAGYSSPTLLTVDGSKQLVCFTATGVHGIDPANGEELWNYSFKTPYDCNTATPITIDGGVFISSGENHGCVLLDVKRDNDEYQVTERWSSLEPKSVMRNEWQTSVVVGDYLYGFDNVGSAGPITHLSCVRAKTGEPVWSETRFGKANLTLADGKLWITTMKGELVLARVTPEGYEELGRRRLFGKTRQSLSIANGHGFIRDDREVICLKLSKD
ncbi:MAG: PQQ-like beta-propeller repeat protein [Rubripirellula sp.]|nr:PQQ-like beta-propeller repeat protein [Rubripirellula sp.]